MDEHTFDVFSDYCTRCGSSREIVVDHHMECCSHNENVVAISHIIADARWHNLVKRVFLNYNGRW